MQERESRHRRKGEGGETKETRRQPRRQKGTEKTGKGRQETEINGQEEEGRCEAGVRRNHEEYKVQLLGGEKG